MPDGEESRRNDDMGITHVHQFYYKRPLYLLSKIFSVLNNTQSPNLNYLKYTFDQTIFGLSKLNRYGPTHYSQVNRMLSGTLYIGSQVSEVSLPYLIGGKINRLKKALELYKKTDSHNCIITQSSSRINAIPQDSIDYIFTDPPFGGNLMYSELNFLHEAWYKVFTNNRSEAVVNDVQRKGLPEYQALMERCFAENYRILKPGRWMTVEFHNSQNKVWMAIQQALTRAGFIIADVRTLDKKQGTFKQVTTTSAVKQDLIISAYKPNGGLEERFKLTAGTVEGVWDFVRQHLRHLPIAPEKDGILQYVPERQKHLLYDRMVAFHVQRGIIVPISSGDFYLGLYQRFPERDGMYFLPDQVPLYEQKRLAANRVEQVSLFVHDEKSAIRWLRIQLSDHPQTYQEIQPKFMIESRNTDRHEAMPELADLLEQNFLKDEEGRWYVPDPNREADLEKLREKALLREFETYKTTKGRLKVFRTEAVRAGFKKCWSERDYDMIIEIGDRLPPEILQEDDVLLMYYDNAQTRLENN